MQRRSFLGFGGGEHVPHAHVVVMLHATREILDRSLADLEDQR